MECHVLQKADGSSENLAEDSDKYTCHIPTTVSSMDGTFGHLPVQQSVANTALDGTGNKCIPTFIFHMFVVSRGLFYLSCWSACCRMGV
ncbi:hypothetical protein DPMN_170281 [Dreissena polymorpha]|uniref:Uncharacterized protein n=1 Tax=Dreissena polymorpha TaxID=45954 RepID=A0A9D4DZ62_DREPO|nr:hypothetical protein DPMN_170281 [Dreissena polymorpha]